MLGGGGGACWCGSYEQLVKSVPDSDEYKMYYAQSLFKAGMFTEAARACLTVDNPAHSQRVRPSTQGHSAGKGSETDQDPIRVCWVLCSAGHPKQMLKLQAAIKYEQDELAAARSYVDQCLTEDPDVVVAHACMLYKVSSRGCDGCWMW